MLRKSLIALTVLVLLSLGASNVFTLNEMPEDDWSKSTPVSEVLARFGEPTADHQPSQNSPEMVEKGGELIHTGVTTGPDGQKTRLQSRYFVCTNCHTMKQEDPDLRWSDPERRLSYANENGLPFLQATTMFGTVNKVSWYNGDYYRKYGDLVKPANKSLKEAIHLCATVCSQGRDFTDWEMDAVLAYLWSIEYTLGDLALTDADWKKLKESQGRRGPNPEMAAWLKGFYRSGSPATFLEVPEDKHEGYTEVSEGNAERGRLIYDISCLSCHNRQGPSNYLKLDHGSLSLGMLRRKMGSKGHLSLYEIVRHGTYADKGHRAYMPHFTAERMSNQQVEDLRAYIEVGDPN